MVAFNDNSAITEFWDSQLTDFEKLAGEAWEIPSIWYRESNPLIANATGHINAALFASLIQFLKIGDKRWASQLVHGFPLTGYLCQSGVFPVQIETLAELRDPSALFNNASHRFQQRAQRSFTPHQQYMWGETIREQARGWFNPPRCLTKTGNFRGYPGEPCNPTVRFPVVQADKIRLIDDLEHSEVNRYTLVGPPITLPTWDLVVELCLRVNPAGMDWSFGKVDRQSAYKNLPIARRGQQFVSIVVKNPGGKRFYAFTPTTQLFGPTASVLRYNVLSRLLVAILIRGFAIPAIGYYDDYGFLVPTLLAEKAMNTVKRVFAFRNHTQGR